MSLRSAAAKLENLSKAHSANNDTMNQQLVLALAELADGLFREFSGLQQRLDKLETAQQRIETRLDQTLASDQ